MWVAWAGGGLGIASPGPDKESNWLPGPASGPFTLTFRAYIPGKDIVEQTWFAPGMQAVGVTGDQKPATASSIQEH